MTAPRKSSISGILPVATAAINSSAEIWGIAESLLNLNFCQSFQTSQQASSSRTKISARPECSSSKAMLAFTVSRISQPALSASPAHKVAPAPAASKNVG